MVVRSLRRAPGFAAIAIPCLALGIGASTTIFSAVNAVLLRPLPFPEPHRLVTVSTRDGRGNLHDVAPETYAAIAAQDKVLESSAAIVAGTRIGFDLTDQSGAVRVPGAVVTASFFRVIGVTPVLGRDFSVEEESSLAPVAVISSSLARRLYGRAGSALGRSVRLNDRIYTVIGVVSAGFDLPHGAQIWVPDPLHAERVMNASLTTFYRLQVIARLRPMVSLAQAQSALGGLSGVGVPPLLGGVGSGLQVTALQDRLLGSVRPVLLAVFGAVLVLQLITCVNLASLLLARAAARQHEMAVRTALGAGRGWLVWQILSEGLLVAALGGVAGVATSWVGMRLFVAIAPMTVLHLDALRLDSGAVAFAAGEAILTGFAIGLVPSLHGTTVELRSVLAASSQASGSGLRLARLQTPLVVAELALTLLLISVAGLMAVTLRNLLTTPLGFDPRNLLSFTVTLTGERYRQVAPQHAFVNHLLDRLAGDPRIRAAAAVSTLPLSGGGLGAQFRPEGYPPPQRTSEFAIVQFLSGDYFRAMSIPLRQGRVFTIPEREANVVIVDEIFAKKYFTNSFAVGKQVEIDGLWRKVIGVVGTVQHEALGRNSELLIYQPLSQSTDSWPTMSFVLRTRADPELMAAVVRSALKAEDPGVPPNEMASFEERLGASVSRQRFTLDLLSTFSGASLLLAALGIYGVMAYFVAQRTGEIGVRMALGASGRQVATLVLWRALIIAGTGIVFGVTASAALGRLLRGLLYGVSAADPMILTVSAALLVVTAISACGPQAIRAARQSPIVAIRGD